MSETTTAVIEKVTSKPGETNGKKWVKYSVKTEDGAYYSTFDRTIAEDAHGLIGVQAELAWKPSGDLGQYKDILAARAVNGSAAASDVIPTERDEQGNANWDVIGLRKTRCLLWAQFLGSPLAAAIYEAPEASPDSLYRIGAAAITLAERDIYWREPAAEDEDLPFG